MTEFVEIRFKLNPKTDSRLLARIKDQANGASENDAARFLMRHWFETERQTISPQLGQHLAPQLGQKDEILDDEWDTSFKDIDDEWD